MQNFKTVLVLFALSISSIYSQISDSNLVGIVLDPSSAGVTAAKIELRHLDTQVARRAESDQEGHYRFSNVPSGRYQITVVKEGFSPSVVEAVDLELGRTLTVNVNLRIATSSQSLIVVEAATPVDTTTSTLQTRYGRTLALQMPITGTGALGPLNLSLLAPGVATTGGLGFGVGPSVGGQRPSSNNFMVEGIDVNNRAVTGPLLTVSNEATAEVSVQQNQFSTEMGHSSAGQFNTVLVSGTNQFHGAFYEYFQNRKLNAVDEAYRRQGMDRMPRFDQNRFGGALGGPLVRNRVFGFLNGEYQLQGRQSVSPGTAYAPTAEGLERLAATPGVSRSNLAVLERHLPAPAAAVRNVSVLGRSIPVGLLNTTGPSYSNYSRTVASVDAYLSPASELRGRWISQTEDSIENSPSLRAFYSPVAVRSDVVSVAHLHTLGPALLNEFRAGFSRSAENRPAAAAQFPGLDAFPNLEFADLSLGLGSFSGNPQSNRSNTIQLANNLTWLMGRHSLKFGYDGRRYQGNFNFVQYQRGYYIYNTLERYLQDLTPEFGLRAVGAAPFPGDLKSHYGFVADEFRVKPNLTITAGLRYEYVGVSSGAQRQALNRIASVPGVIEFNAPRASRTEFAPRLGVAWSPGGSGRTSLRAGWGLSYDQNPQNMWVNSMPPQYYTMVEAHLEKPNLPNFLSAGGVANAPRAVSDAQSARAQTYAWIPEQQRPYAIQWNAGVQRSLGKDFVFETGYLGTRGVHLPVQMQLNRRAGTSAAQSLPTFLEQPSQAHLDSLALRLEDLKPVNTLREYGFQRSITSFLPIGNSEYHGFTASLTRRYANGMQYKAAYTWSHNIDDSTAILASTMLTPRRPQDFFDLRADRADSMLDRRHRFSFGGSWEPRLGFLQNALYRSVVNGWRVSGSLMAETGAWGTVRSGIDSNLNGDPAADRSMVNPAGVAGRSTTVTKLTNSTGSVVGYLAKDPTARYVQAGQGVLPNAGRNTLRLPGINNIDLALGRTFRVRERTTAEFRVEAYNLLNHAQFVPGFTNSVDFRPRVSPAATSVLLTGNPLFNRPDLAFESNSRQFQLVLRIAF